MPDWLGQHRFPELVNMLATLGVEMVDEMKWVSPEEMTKLRALLKPVQQRRFNAELEKAMRG
jgi:hypothetical protein